LGCDSFDDVTIPAGSSSTSYSMPTSDDAFSNIHFDCEKGCLGNGITSEGSWSETEGVTGTSLFNSSTEYDSQLDHIVDISLENAVRFKGRVEFPENFKATGSEDITIEAEEYGLNNFFLANSFRDFVVLSERASFAEFDFNVPVTGPANGSWQLSFSCFLCRVEISPAEHFATTINGGLGTTFSGNAFPFESIGNYTNLSLLFPGEIPAPKTSLMSPIIFLLED